MHARYITAVGLLALAAACSPKPTYKTLANPTADFRKYRTYTFADANKPPVGYGRAGLPKAAAQAAANAAKNELTRLGYAQAPLEAADMVLVVGMGRRTNITRQARYPTGYHPHYNDTMDEYELQVEEGTLVVDAYDRQTRNHIWNGSVSAVLEGEIKAEGVAEAVHDLFSRFPPQSQGPEKTSGN